MYEGIQGPAQFNANAIWQKIEVDFGIVFWKNSLKQF